MMKYIKSSSMYLLLLVMILFTLATVSQPIFACSGNPQPLVLEEMLEREVVVKGRVIETDSIEQSAILQVEAYFKGEGPQYLLLSRANNTLYMTHGLRNYDTGCLYDGMGENYNVVDQGYYALNRRANGTWSDGGGIYGAAAFYPIYEDSVSRAIIDPENDSERLIDPVSIDEFEAMLMEETGSVLLAPNIEAPFPLRTPLRITTESGQEYLLPVDYGPLYERTSLECEFRCTVFSPDGTHIAMWVSTSEFKFTYPYSMEEDYTEYDPERGVLPGEAVWFSPNSDYALVQDGDFLRVYILNNDMVGGLYGAYITPIELAQIPISLSEDISLAVEWAGNSGTFAFMDGAGIFVFDLNWQHEPALVISIEDLHNEFAGGGDLLGISTTGRYVRFGSARYGWYLQQIPSGERLFNGITPPDESKIVRIDAIQRPSSESCHLPLGTECVYERVTDIEHFIVDWGWVDNISVYALRCKVDDPQQCQVLQYQYLYQVLEQRKPEYIPIRSVDYDQAFNYFAVALDDGQITISPSLEQYTRRSGTEHVIDVRDQLDSSIDTIEWENSIFFTLPR